MAASRPFGVTIVAIIAWISGALQTISGIFALIGGGATNGSWTPWATLAIGIITIVVSLGLFRGSNASRWIVAIVFILNIAFGVYAATQGLVGWWSVLWSALLPLIGLLLLFSSKANRFFR
jgi:hypothetical protein